MSVNDLLTWMSMKQQGSWSQFREAVERLHLADDTANEDDEGVELQAAAAQPAYQSISFNLQRLAHAEFFYSTLAPDWRVVPPSLAIHKQRDKWIGIVCGARTPDFIKNVRRLSGLVQINEFEGMPDRISLSCSDLDLLTQTAAKLKLTTQLNAPEIVLSALPQVADARNMNRSEPPPRSGWLIEKFGSSSLTWEESREPLEKCNTALFRYTRSYQKFYYLRWQRETFSINALIGKYALLSLGSGADRRQLTFDRERRLLSAPFSLRPPMLIERALVLTTGNLPEYDWSSSRIIYNGISPRIASLAAALLCQEISQV